MPRIINYIGYSIALIVGIHVLILSFMVLALLVQPEIVVHVPYWDALLRLIIK